MHRDIRRKDRIMPDDRMREMLVISEYGVLSTVDDDGQPYGIPLSYVLMDDSIYFHVAVDGQKLDNIRTNNKVSFTCIGNTQPVYDNNFSTYYESIIVYGKAEFIQDEVKKQQVLMALAEKYLPEYLDKAPEAINRSSKITLIVKMSVEHITGKAKYKK